MISINVLIKIILLAQEPNFSFYGMKYQEEKDISRRYNSWTACVFHICLKVLARLVTCSARLSAVFFNDFHPSYLRKHWTLTFSKWRTFTLWANRDCFGQIMLSIWSWLFVCTASHLFERRMCCVRKNLWESSKNNMSILQNYKVAF